MADLSNQKRLAAEVMKVGQSRVRIDPDRNDEVAGAVTRADIRKLVDCGVIVAGPEGGALRGHARAAAPPPPPPPRHPGTPRPAPRRAELRKLRESAAIDASVYRDYYVRAKGGQF